MHSRGFVECLHLGMSDMCSSETAPVITLAAALDSIHIADACVQAKQYRCICASANARYLIGLADVRPVDKLVLLPCLVNSLRKLNHQ